jgi:hypothetical protein
VRNCGAYEELHTTNNGPGLVPGLLGITRHGMAG